MTVPCWTGREAAALRQARRMSIRAYAQHLGVSLDTVANWQRRGEQARLRTETQQMLDTDLARAGDDVRQRFAQILTEHATADTPAPRLAAPDRSTATPAEPSLSYPDPPAVASGSDGGDLNRRAALKGATVSAFAALIGAVTGAFGQSPPDSRHRQLHEEAVQASLHRSREAYQHARYSTAAHSLAATLRILSRAAAPDEPVPTRSAVLCAQAYQIASGLLLKADQPVLAAICAERSITSATATSDELLHASSTRAVVHTLLAAGQPEHAAALATDAADRLASRTGMRTAAAQSLYGALLLRGALAASRHGDHQHAATLLDAAADTAGRLGHDDNQYWTAFGPTNVAVHRVAVAVDLGDAGTAVRTAATVNPNRLDLPERRANLLLDTARAYTQWGKWDQALHCIQNAEDQAPEEVRRRPAVHQMLRDLVHRTPEPARRHAHDYARHIGALP
ncbi:helix-turn-helix domain-containing protein [Mangrovihabitans endophyticus]|uniref:HTH cro/C1-type domain-containing protein n=1 Tax=Mangrovihabitans endophyticus TaxID=1751298 RepID=A0A8J3C8H8_9ACTN|nr:hypothetical protein [Mangrovihabitans endophyticus]GGL18988.1 hypothetical protein GCM10012284_61950 [Mangrovihabitans endophyticus]